MKTRGKRQIDEALLIALACGSTVENAARTIGVSVRTIQRRLAEPEFQARLAQIKADMIHRTVGMLTAGSLEAVKTLMLLLQPTQPPTVRLGASRAVLEMSLKTRLGGEIADRIAELERQLATPGEC